VLEHLSRTSMLVALRNTYRMLRPSGIFRLIVPDLEARARRYLADLESRQSDANDRFLRSSYLGAEADPKGLAGFASEKLGRSKHLWMWDYQGIDAALRATGFTSIRRCEMGDSGDPAFAAVEQHDRFFQRERINPISLLEFAPRAQSCPLDVAAHHAAHERRANADPIGEFAPQLRIKFDVERNRAGAADLIRVRFLIVKDHRAAAALADMVSRALDKTAAEHVSEEGCCMAVLRQPRPWVVRGLESVETGLGEDPSNAPGCRGGGSFIG